jgi:hypothetical protein
MTKLAGGNIYKGNIRFVFRSSPINMYKTTRNMRRQFTILVFANAKRIMGASERWRLLKEDSAPWSSCEEFTLRKGKCIYYYVYLTSSIIYAVEM